MKNLMKYMDGKDVSSKKLKESIINKDKQTLNESVSDTYSKQVNVRANTPYQELTVQGKMIEEVEISPIRLNYDISIEAREWGIKDISIGNINGPSEVNAYVTYYPNPNDDSKTEEVEVTIPINWETLEQEIKNGTGIISIGNEVEIDIVNDQQGNLVVNKISELIVYSI